MDLQKIKNRINCLDYAARFGITVTRSGARTTSLDGGDNKTALVIYEDYWYDFKLAQGGDVIDLCAVHKYDGDRGRAIAELAQIVGLENEPQIWKKYIQNLSNLCQKWHEALRDEDRAYINKRGITNETIERLKIGYTTKGFKVQTKDGYLISNYAHERISIPWWKNGYISGWIARATIPDDEHKYLKPINDDTKDYSAVFGLHTIGKNTDTLVIVEGAFDALSFEQEGYSVLATMGGHFSKEQMKSVLSICKQFKTVFLCFDSDTAGTQFTLRLSKDLFSHKIPFVLGELPGRYKDVSEYYEGGSRLQTLIDDAKNGLIAMCEKMTNKEEFKDFAYKAARFVGKPELAELFNAVKGNAFPPDWLAEVKKSCLSPPSEDYIAGEVCKKHNLKYKENVGFFEYIQNKGYWKRREETEIQSFIGDALGNYRTGSRLSSILKLIKTDCVTNEEFDKKPLFCFINGTLELGEIRLFREHRESDLCSIQVAYAYDNSAHSERWQAFVDQICNYDQTRSTLLQEMAGYILFPDCSLEKIFVLTGSGGNGKSKFLEVIKAVFGEENCSSVTATGLCADFQRINISKSLLNIAQEIKSDLSGAEEYLKQIASGETVSACFKGKNFVDFKPRCKMFFATNGQLKSRDTSDGLMRRLAIIDFVCKFVDEPTKANEYKRDTQLLSKLMQDLPAVFNWALNGYINLIIKRSFTETYDQTDLVEDFKEASNPIITFIKDWNKSGMISDIAVFGGAPYISKEDLYEEYRSWCVQAGHIAKSRRGFLREFNNVKGEDIVYVDTTISGQQKKQGYKKVMETVKQTSLVGF